MMSKRKKYIEKYARLVMAKLDGLICLQDDIAKIAGQKMCKCKTLGIHGLPDLKQRFICFADGNVRILICGKNNVVYQHFLVIDNELEQQLRSCA